MLTGQLPTGRRRGGAVRRSWRLLALLGFGDSEDVCEPQPRSHARAELNLLEDTTLYQSTDRPLAQVEDASSVGLRDERVCRASGLAVGMDLYRPHLARKATVLETPKKPVTLALPIPTMWTLAVALGLSREQSRRFQSLYDHASEGKGPEAVLLGISWQERTGHLDEGAVTAPWTTELHHRIADVLEERDAPGRIVALGRGESVQCPTVVRLPCRDCGHMLVSGYRGGHFRRTCGLCFPYSPAAPEHPRGGLTLHVAGGYPNRRAGSTLGVEKYGQDVLCAHPECLTLFVATRGDEEYCPEHRGRREEARRLRSRMSFPKHERFRFCLAPGMNSVLYHHGPNALGVRILPGDIRVARDESELRELAALLLRGTLTVDS
jgi:hypothetical protein